jgi:hypothetical protein
MPSITILILDYNGNDNLIVNETDSLHIDQFTPMGLTPEGKYHLEVNMTIQKIFVGFNPATLDLPVIESFFDTTYEIIRDSFGVDFTINYTLNYDYIIADQSYYNSLYNYATLNSQLTTTSKINETALALQHADGIPRSIFLEQDGYAINASAVDDWIEANPYTTPPTNGYRFYVLNFSSMDAIDHSIEHWFDFENINIDSNQTISYFRLEWDNELNPVVKFPYPGFDSKYGSTYILDPSAYQWYSKWRSIYGTGSLPVDPFSYIAKDLDDIQRENDLVTNKIIMANYLHQWIYEIIDLMITDGNLGNLEYRDTDSISVQTLILNGDDKPLEEIEWVTSEERIFEQLDYAMPFIDWEIDVTFDNLSNYPIIEQAFHDSLISNISNFWQIDGLLAWDNLYSRRHLIFDLNAADDVITAIVLIRSDMVMDYGGGNYTGLGGNNNVLALKSRERYFQSDGVTPKSGISEVLIHEIGHCLGFGHPHGPGEYCRGTMTYYNTRHEFNQFYVDILRRGQTELRYCEVKLDLIKDKERYGLGPFVPQIEGLITDIETLLEDTIQYHNQMDYLQAVNSINLAREKMAELQALREQLYGRIRNIGFNSLGMTESIFVENNIAYVPSGQQLLLIDVSTPSNPALLSSLEIPYYAMDVYVENNLAYLSHIDYGFSIIDVSNPLNPTLLAVVSDCGTVTDVHVKGDFVFVAMVTEGVYNYGIHVYNITSPENPIQMNQQCYGQEVRRIITDDKYLYAAINAKYPNGTLYSSINIFNIENPYLINQIGEYIEPERSFTLELFISGSYLFACQLTGSGNYLNIYNVAVPSNILFVDHFSADDVILDCHITSTHAYIACNEDGLIIVNIATLTEVSRLDTDVYLWGVFVKGNNAYLADLGSLIVVDITDPATPIIIGSFETTPVTSSFVAVKDDYAYIGDTTKGFSVFDVSDKTNPIQLDHIDVLDGVLGLEISGNYLYIIAFPYYFHIYNITNPANPVEVGSYNCTTQPFGLTIQGNYAYLGIYDRFSIIDITDKTNPYEIGGVDTLPFIYDILIDGNFAYLACEADGLQIIDLSVLTNPTIVSTTNLQVNAYEIVGYNNYVIIGHSSGMTTVDVTNPNNPTIVYDYNMFDIGISSLKRQDDLLFAATYHEGIRIFNISNPTRPIEIGFNNSIYYAQDIVYDGGAFFVSNYRCGLWIFDHDVDTDLLYSIDEIAFGSDPFMYDTDYDGYSDYEEWLHGTDPRDPNDYPNNRKNILIGSIVLATSYGIGFTVLIIVIIRRRKIH